MRFCMTTVTVLPARYPVLPLAQDSQAVADGLGERQRVGAEEQGAAAGYLPD